MATDGGGDAGYDNLGAAAAACRPTDAAPTLAGRTLSHYEVLEEIGRGGMGTVYRARDLKLSREVALKVLRPGLVADPEQRRRFLQEACASAALVDAHVIVVHDVDDVDGVAFIAMEFIDGEKLSRTIARGLTLDCTLDLATQVAKGLAKAHERGIVHRDVKPTNVMVTHDGRAKLIDFGLAKLAPPPPDAANDADTCSHLDTAPGVVMGTMAYMSPEQARGQALDQRTDIFSFGVVLYEMLAGTPPFRGESTFDTLQAIVTAPAPPLRLGVGDGAREMLEKILQRCLAKNPHDRYHDASELLADLRVARRQLASSQPLATSAATTGAPIVGRLLRSRAATVGAATLGALAMLTVVPRDRAIQEHAVRSVVALPSRVYAGAADTFLTDAVPTTLSTYLTQVDGLETKLPPSSVDIERIGGDLDKAAEAYRVNAFVLSTVAVQADRFSLTVQLVEPHSRRLLWSREYEGSRSGYQHLVREAAEGVRAAVRPDASPVPTPSGSSNVELALQRGRHYLTRYGALYRLADAEQAALAFQHVLDLDPRRAEAAAAMAVLFGRRHQFGDASAFAETEKWARRALEIDPRSSQGWSVLSYVERRRPGGNPRMALDLAQKAATFGPGDPLAQANLGAMMSDTSCLLALEAFNEGARIDPLYFNAKVASIATLDLLGRQAEAEASIQHVLRLEPDAPGVLIHKALRLDGRHALERRALLARLENMVVAGRMNPRWFAMARDFAALDEGPPAAARTAVEHLAAIAKGTSPFAAWDTFVLSGVIRLARQGRRADALDVLAQLDASGGAVPYDVLLRNDSLTTLRHDPRFESVLGRARRRFEDAADTLESAHARGELPAYLAARLHVVLPRLPRSSWQLAEWTPVS